MAEPILFLDVDGVLNHKDVFLPGRHYPPLCEKCLAQFVRVTAETDARIVLSSTWRLLPNHVEELKAAGVLDKAHDDWRTIELPFITRNGLIVQTAIRGHEIAEWLARHPEVERYAIVDDEATMLDEQQPFFVQTDFEAAGLTSAHADRLIALLRALRSSEDSTTPMERNDG
jgi:hypothetical protein